MVKGLGDDGAGESMEDLRGKKGRKGNQDGRFLSRIRHQRLAVRPHLSAGFHV